MYKVMMLHNHKATIFKKTKVERKARLMVEYLRSQGIRAYCSGLGYEYSAAYQPPYTHAVETDRVYKEFTSYREAEIYCGEKGIHPEFIYELEELSL